MGGGRWALLGCLALLCAAVLGAAPRAEEPLVATRTALGEHPDKTRFVIDLSGEASYAIFTLADPYRVVIDLPEVSWRLPPDTGLTGKGLVKGFRYGLFRPGKSRVVLDLWDAAAVKDHRLLPPDDRGRVRLVIDLEPTAADAFRAAAGWPASPQGEVPAPPLMPTDRLSDPGEKPVVVLDPGHGGVDPGATGPGGTHEREIVLDLGLTLRDQLLATGRYEVVMTRESDVYVDLHDRVAIARRASADLFLSLHADSINKPQIRGASVYTLSEKASDAEAEALARTENAADVIAGADLSGETDEVISILIDLAQRETLNYSVAFARQLAEDLAGETRVLDKPHRQANFRVLKAPDVPSVLLELGFLSNAEDEKTMLSDAWRRRVSRAIVTAIDNYFARRRERLGIPPALPRQASRRAVP